MREAVWPKIKKNCLPFSYLQCTNPENSVRGVLTFFSRQRISQRAIWTSPEKVQLLLEDGSYQYF